jgi:heme oxygenase (biliverdin-IX-beta and delta-forming)
VTAALASDSAVCDATSDTHPTQPANDAAGAMNDFASSSLSRREHLKQATLELHRRVENVVDARGYFTSRSTYGSWLLASLAFHRAAYAGVCPETAAHCLGPTTISERLTLLERDISALGLVVPPNGEASATRDGDAAETLGVLYVTEGASLGARLLYTRVRKLDVDESTGAAFLGRQAHDLPAWRRFVAALDAFEGTAEQEHRLVQASCRTFELAARHFGTPP